jgi:hypothetical protein
MNVVVKSMIDLNENIYLREALYTDFGEGRIRILNYSGIVIILQSRFRAAWKAISEQKTVNEVIASHHASCFTEGGDGTEESAKNEILELLQHLIERNMVSVGYLSVWES